MYIRALIFLLISFYLGVGPSFATTLMENEITEVESEIFDQDTFKEFIEPEKVLSSTELQQVVNDAIGAEIYYEEEALEYSVTKPDAAPTYDILYKKEAKIIGYHVLAEVEASGYGWEWSGWAKFEHRCEVYLKHTPDKSLEWEAHTFCERMAPWEFW